MAGRSVVKVSEAETIFSGKVQGAAGLYLSERGDIVI